MKKTIIITGTILSMCMVNQIGIITSFAVGSGDGLTAKQPDIVTYNQDTVRTLGNWEQQPDGYWRFKQVTGSYLTNSWVESLAVQGSFYFVNSDGYMITSATAPDGRYVDASGLWKTTAVPNPNVPTAPSAPSNTGSGNSPSNGSKDISNVAGRYAYLFDEEYQKDLNAHPIDTDHSLN
jgi:lipopolysaccharide export LptBFGC system permease protein LptF